MFQFFRIYTRLFNLNHIKCLILNNPGPIEMVISYGLTYYLCFINLIFFHTPVLDQDHFPTKVEGR